MNNLNYKKGYTLGLTMIVVSVVLLLTMSIYSIMYSEFKITGIGDQSMRAYYNADLGIECVKFYENKHKESNPNADSGLESSIGFFLSVGPDKVGYETNVYRSSIKCANTTIDPNTLNTENVTGASRVYVALPNMDGEFFLTKFKIKNTVLDLCTDIKVYKTSTNINALTIVSTGYSSCSAAGEPRISREVVYQRGFIN